MRPAAPAMATLTMITSTFYRSREYTEALGQAKPLPEHIRSIYLMQIGILGTLTALRLSPLQQYPPQQGHLCRATPPFFIRFE